MIQSLSRALLCGEIKVPVKIKEQTKEHFLINFEAVYLYFSS